MDRRQAIPIIQFRLDQDQGTSHRVQGGAGLPGLDPQCAGLYYRGGPSTCALIRVRNSRARTDVHCTHGSAMYIP